MKYLIIENVLYYCHKIVIYEKALNASPCHVR